MKKLRAPIAGALVAATLLVAGTVTIDTTLAGSGHDGGDGHDEGHGHNEGHGDDEGHGGHGGAMLGGAPGHAHDVTQTIEIVPDELSFSVDRIVVSAGETVRIVFRNTSDIEHELTIGTAEVQAAHRREMEKMMDEMADDGHDHTHMAHDDPNAVFLAPGEAKEIIWKFAETENLEFGCNIPGHYESGMRGTIHFH